MIESPVSREEFNELQRNFNEVMNAFTRSSSTILDSMKMLDKRLDAMEAWRKAITTPKRPSVPPK